MKRIKLEKIKKLQMNKWQLTNSKPIFESKWISLFSNDYLLPNGKEAGEYYKVMGILSAICYYLSKN